jgi:hypothetical protein
MPNNSNESYSAGGYLAYFPGGLSARLQSVISQYEMSRPRPETEPKDFLKYHTGWTYGLPDRKDSIDDLLVGKAAFLGRRLDDIQADIARRDKLLNDNLYQLEREICHVDSRIYNLLQLPEIGEGKTLAAKKTSLYTRLADLEKEKRDQRVSCWADEIRLKKELFEIAENYTSAKTREGLWGDLNGAD